MFLGDIEGTPILLLRLLFKKLREPKGDLSRTSVLMHRDVAPWRTSGPWCVGGCGPTTLQHFIDRLSLSSPLGHCACLRTALFTVTPRCPQRQPPNMYYAV
ncbi:hypothetical protein PISMIDRAFT_687658, partial [Pisolithus microcarpus 441]